MGDYTLDTLAAKLEAALKNAKVSQIELQNTESGESITMSREEAYMLLSELRLDEDEDAYVGELH